MKFHELTKSDPLFYDPNTDVSYLRDSVRSLKNMDDEILRVDKMYRKSETGKHRDVFPDDWRLWPDEFLSTLPSVHEATVSFLDRQTRENAQTLLQEYENTVENYSKAIKLQAQAMETVLARSPERKQKKILFLGSATTPKIVLNDFLLIRKNAQALEEEVKQRKECLYKGECSTKERTNDADVNKDNILVIPYKPLSEDMLGIEKDKVAVFGPYYAATDCFGFTETGGTYSYPFYVVGRPSKNGEKGILNLMFTNTKYYRDYRKVPDQPVAKIWLKRGITIRPHPGLSDYLCTDLRYMPELFMKYLKETQEITEISQKNKLATLPYLIQRTITYSGFLIYDLMNTKKSYDPLYLLINRSAYSLYFGTFSSSIWRIADMPTFLLKEDFTDISLRNGYTRYENLIAEGLSIEELKKLNSLPRVNEVYREEFFGTSSGQISPELDF